jgi:hypothetical protein
MAPSKSNAEMANTQEGEKQISAAQKAFSLMCERMALAATAEDDSFPAATLQGIVAILTAETEAEMWDADDLAQIGGRNLRDVEQRIKNYAVKYSNNPDIDSVFRDDNGRRMYLLVQSDRLDTGEEMVWNTSAPAVVTKILWLADRDKLPYECVIRGRDMGGGQVFLRLKPIPQRIEQSEEPPF